MSSAIHNSPLMKQAPLGDSSLGLNIWYNHYLPRTIVPRTERQNGLSAKSLNIRHVAIVRFNIFECQGLELMPL